MSQPSISVLERIAARTRERVAAAKTTRPISVLQREAAARQQPPKDFRQLFHSDAVSYPVIAEVKLASPSQGPIAPQLDPVRVADDYLQNGATALSVLTEPEFFQGDVRYLTEIRASHPSAALLMKDFFLDEYQLYQALAAGADAVLVIVAMLGEEHSARLIKKARELGLTPLVEVHNREELAIALRLGADLIGINSRNLKTMAISLETILELLSVIPAGHTVIGESGIRTTHDLDRLKAAGCHGFLVGTHLMATGQPGQALATLLGEGR
jgi:indole-3-glycerol phosphate synthase